MLILTRKTGEKVKLGNDIDVTVLEIDKGSVKIGFDAPKEVTILRHEVHDSIQQKNIDAAQSSVENLSNIIGIWKEQGGE